MLSAGVLGEGLSVGTNHVEAMACKWQRDSGSMGRLCGVQQAGPLKPNSLPSANATIVAVAASKCNGAGVAASKGV